MITKNLSRLMFQNMDKLHNAGSFIGKQIVLFGRNASSLGMYDFLTEKGIQNIVFIDNDTRKHDTLRPDEFLVPYRDDVVILIASKYYDEMCRQLESMGYTEGKQIIKTVDFYGIDSLVQDDDGQSGKRMDRQQIREKQMEIVDEVDRICRENHLRYSLCGGTLLGAIRHQGYIPWDDDIDIILPYPDYCRLFELLKQNEKYRPISIWEDGQEFPMMFGRIESTDTRMKLWEYPFLFEMGIYIDVFPTWGLPDDEEARLKHYDEIRKLKTALLESYVRYPDAGGEEIARRNEIVSRAYRLIEEVPFDEAQYVAYAAGKNGIKEIVPKRIYDSFTEMKFENRKYMCMDGYDVYLSSLYGDYMTPPPKGEQGTTHSFVAYDIACTR